MPKKSRRKAKAGRLTANDAVPAASIDKDTGAAPMDDPLAAPTLPSGIECRTDIVSEGAQIPILPTVKVTADEIQLHMPSSLDTDKIDPSLCDSLHAFVNAGSANGWSKEEAEQKGNTFVRSVLGSGLRVSLNSTKSGEQVGSFTISGSGSTAPKISDDVMAKVAAVISDGRLKKWPISLIEERAKDTLDSALVAGSDTVPAFPNQNGVCLQPNGALAAKITDEGDVEIYLPQGFDRRGLIYQPFYTKIAEVAFEGKRRGKPKAQMEKKATGILLSTFKHRSSDNIVEPPAMPDVPQYVRKVDWSYGQRLGLAQAWYRRTRSFHAKSDLLSALDTLAGYFRFPLQQTEPFRAPMLLLWFYLREGLAEADVKSIETYETFFRWDRTQSLLQQLSSDQRGEGMMARALASHLRANTLHDVFVSYFTPSEVTHLRRFIAFAETADREEFATAYEALVGESPARQPSPSLRTLDSNLRGAKNVLAVLEGPPQTSFESIYRFASFSPDNGMYPFYLTVGGQRCDCCGKYSNEVNLPMLFKCKACRLARYCSTECQAKSWRNGHREHCKKFGCFREGDLVLLMGLVKRGDLNNALATVEASPGSNGRATVRIVRNAPPLENHVAFPAGSTNTTAVRTLASNNLGSVVSIKKENLRHHRPLK